MMMMMIKEGKVLSNSTTNEGCKNHCWTIWLAIKGSTCLIPYWLVINLDLLVVVMLKNLPSVFVASCMLAFCVTNKWCIIGLFNITKFQPLLFVWHAKSTYHFEVHFNIELSYDIWQLCKGYAKINKDYCNVYHWPIVAQYTFYL